MGGERGSCRSEGRRAGGEVKAGWKEKGERGSKGEK